METKNKIHEPEIFYAYIRDSGDGNTFEITIPKEVYVACGFKKGDQLKCFVKKVEKVKK